MPLIDPVTMSSAGAPQSPAGKPSVPIEILQTDIAKFIAHAHPALLLTTYYARFPALVAAPVSTLLHSILPLALAQIIYAVTCLPAVGSGTKTVKKVKLNAPKKTELPTGNAFVCQDLWILQECTNRLLQTVFFALLLSLFSVPVLTAIQILFGAPVTSHLLHTLLSSAHIALLAIFPLIYVHGADSKKWREIVSFYSPIDEVFGGAAGAFLGAWVGAVPIPLDWDREWQKWPVTIITGAYLGYALGKVAGGWVFRGKRIELS